MKNCLEKQSSISNKEISSKNKVINIMFDASSSTSGIVSECGNGIFFVSYNILLKLIKEQNVEINIFVPARQIPVLKKAIEIDDNLKNLKIIDTFSASLLDYCINNAEKIIYDTYEQGKCKIFMPFIRFIIIILNMIKSFKLKLNPKLYDSFYKDIDIYFSTFNPVPKEIRGLKRIKKYTIIHDTIPLALPEYKKDYIKRGRKDPFYKIGQSINEEDYYFANSEYTKQDFIKYFPQINKDHITVIPLSSGGDYKQINDLEEINKIKEKYGILKDNKYIFSLYSSENRKNFIFTLKNFAEFISCNKIDNLVFVLGGNINNSFMQKLNELTEKLPILKNKIIKTGYIKNNDMSALYSGAEMFVFASLYEGFGMPIVEAMKCGCPVICSKITSMPEVIGDCGITIDPTQNQELVKAFEKMYFDSNFRTQCKIKGLERSKIFTWEDCIDVIIKTIMQGVEG